MRLMLSTIMLLIDLTMQQDAMANIQLALL